MCGVSEIKKEVAKLKEQYEKCKRYKKQIKKHHKALQKKLRKRRITHSQHREILKKKIKGRTTQEWHEFYDTHSNLIEQKIKAHKENIKTHRKFKLLPRLIPIIFLVFLFSFLILFMINVRLNLTGFAVQEGIETNEYIDSVNLKFNESAEIEWIPENQGVLSSLKISGSIEGNSERFRIGENKTTDNHAGSGVEVKIYLDDLLIFKREKIEGVLQNNNETNSTEELLLVENFENFEDVCEETCDISKLNLNKSSYKIKIEISDAEITIDKIKYEIISQIKETPEKIKKPKQNITEISPEENETKTQFQAEINKPVKWKEQIKSKNIDEARIKLPKRAKIINELEISKELFEVEYETPAPHVIEEETEKGKIVYVNSPEGFHYENVIAYTNLSESLNVKSPSKIKIKWVEQNEFITPDKIEDTDANGIYDYIEWTIPLLNNQTFEIIVIIKAEHLDSNREFVSDIYEQVKSLDGIWSETISDGDYVRVTFEIPLDSSKDITIYPKVTSGAPKIEVYEFNGTELIAEFSSLNSNEYNKVFLTNLGQGQCYDSETEVLTENGWKLFKELTKKDKVATLNQETGEQEWQFPSARQEFDNDKEMFKIILEDGSEFLVSEKHKVYVGNNLESISLGEKTLISLEDNIPLSPENIGQLSASDSATYGESLSCGANCFALGNNFINPSEGINDISSIKKLYESSNSCSDILVNLSAFDLCFLTSSSRNSGATNSNFSRSELNRNTECVTPLLIKDEITTLASTTNLSDIFYNNELYLLDKDSLISFANSSACNCVNLDFETACLNRTTLETLVFNKLLTNKDTSISGIDLNSDSSSLGILTLNSVIELIDKPNLNNFGLKPITEVYSYFENGKGVYFLDENNKPVRIKSIAKEKYKGKIYDVDVENDIVLVRRNNSIPVWSGNSEGYSQDTFDLKITGGSVEFEHIIDPVTIEILYVNDYNNTYSAWDTATNDPYLDDSDASLIDETSTGAALHGNFFFANLSAGIQVPSNVMIYFEANNDDGAGDDGFNVFLSPGNSATYTDMGLVQPTGTTYAWFSINVTSLLNTREKVNDANFYVSYTKSAGGDNVRIRRAYLNVSLFDVDLEYPQFTNLKEAPSNNTAYVFGQIYESNSTITSTNGTAGIEFNQVNYTASNILTIFNSTISNLNASVHSYYWWSYGNGTNKYFNRTITQFYTITKAAPTASLTNDTLWTRAYNRSGTTIGVSENNNGDGGVTYVIFQENVSQGQSDVEGSVGAYVYVLNTTGGMNYSSSASLDSKTLTITAIASSINLTLNNSQRNATITQGNSIDLNVSIILGDSGAFLLLYRNGNLINNGTSPIKNSTTFNTIQEENITAYYSPSRNYTLISQTFYVNVTPTLNQAPTNPAFVNITSADKTNLSSVNLNCSAQIEDPDAGSTINVTVQWYNNSKTTFTYDYNVSYANNTLLNSTLSANYLEAWENWSCGMRLYDGVAYSSWVNSSINITILSTPPRVTNVWNSSVNLANGPNEATSTIITINFTAYDIDGFSDLNDATAKINVTGDSTPTVRDNSTCQRLTTFDSYYANYSCAIEMWWWDASGQWNITAYIQDDESKSASNNSQDFYVGLRTSFALGPSILSWPGISPRLTNQTSTNDPVLLNNTGNDDIVSGQIGINATNLLGEENSNLGLWAANFSVGINTGGVSCVGAACTECAGTQMSSSVYTNVTGALLSKGNYSINDGTAGQEQLYLCLRYTGSELITQTYSTGANGAWTIRILLVSITGAGAKTGVIASRKKKKKTKKKLIENLTLPSAIFTKKLGCLEAITKYMKDNLKMSYSEIANILNRNERTIWTAYKKAIEKEPETINLERTIMLLPIIKLEKILLVFPTSIFENKSLTTLESIIIYLKENGMKYSEISKLLNRDQRNIWTIHSKAINKKSKL